MYSQVYIQGSSTNNYLVKYNNTSTSAPTAASTSSIFDNGSVGILTNIPQQPLHVVGKTRFDIGTATGAGNGRMYLTRTASLSQECLLSFGTNGTTTYDWAMGTYANNPANNDFILAGWSAGRVFTINSSSGNVGLGNMGTSAALEKLHVLGNGIFSSSTSTPTSSAYILGTNSYGTVSAPEYTWYADLNTGMFHKSADVIGFTTNGTERMTIKNEGTVVMNGGGTNTRFATGSANGMIYGTSYLAFNAQRSGTSWTKYTDGANNGGSVIWGNVAGNIYFSPLPVTGTASSDATITDADVTSYKTMEVRWNNTLSGTHKGQVIIGANTVTSGSHTDFKLSVDGKINAKDIVVTYQNWPDYVFEKEYKLIPLEEVKAYIEKNKHLPDVKPASEVTNNGLSLKDETSIQMQKIEELTLYLIQLNEEMQQLKRENEELKSVIKAIQK
ncbi:MAG TPA: hypothetical protein VD905_19785 [Flavobacteriales bacterium]|nr:hypothetical protein [Flavobacteriales bacterium]